MTEQPNTLFLRLAGPFQSWGTVSRLQIRRTDAFPSKSGIFGIILASMGVKRSDSAPVLARLTSLKMGVRIDRSGETIWDYHTVGASIGVLTANNVIKNTEKTGEIETLLSRRQYLVDADFLVALHGDQKHIVECQTAMENPVWPPYLGRKSCIPSEPILAGTGFFSSLEEALASQPWRARPRERGEETRSLTTWIEHPIGSPSPHDALLVHDVPHRYGFHNQKPRFIVPGIVQVETTRTQQVKTKKSRHWVDYNSSEWKRQRELRLQADNYLCVFCKSPATDVHHVTYDVDPENPLHSLRSLCKLCHDACTILEYSDAMIQQRIDPADPAIRDTMLNQIRRLLEQQRRDRRTELMKSIRQDYQDRRKTSGGQT